MPTKQSIDVEPHTVIHVTPATPTLKSFPTDPRHENALDALLDELQTFSKPVPQQQQDGQKRKFGSFDSGKKPVPLPPPRSSSRITDPQEQARQLMILSSLTAAAALANSRVSGQTPTVIRSNSEPTPSQLQQLRPRSTPPETLKSASNESVNSQDGNAFAIVPSTSTTSLSSVDSQGSVIENGKGCKSRQQLLEERHQELLKKQKLLQEQYTRLQILSRGQIPKTLLNDLKKTGSESNILSRAAITSTAVSGSLTHLAGNKQQLQEQQQNQQNHEDQQKTDSTQSQHTFKELTAKSTGNATKHETQKIYETDIL